MRMYETIMVAIAIALFTVAFAFGFDREMARQQYEDATKNGNYEKPITGCIWDYNCEHFTKMLYDTID